MKNIIVFILATFLSTSIFGQARASTALKNFLNTDFFHEFDALRNKAHRSVRDFKAIQYQFKQEEIDKVVNTYDASARLFNNALYNIKEDLLSKDMSKFIAGYPGKYSKIVQADLFLAREFYIDQYQHDIITITNGQISGAGPLDFISQTIQAVKTSIEVYKELRSDLKGVKPSVIDQELIEKHRFKYWKEIE